MGSTLWLQQPLSLAHGPIAVGELLFYIILAPLGGSVMEHEGFEKVLYDNYLPAVGPLYTMVKCLDHKIVRALETQPKVVPW